MWELWGSDEVSPADMSGQEILIPRIAQNGAAQIACLCRGWSGCEKSALSPTHQGQSPSASGQVRTGTSAITTSAVVQTPPAKVVRDSLLFWEFSTSRDQTVVLPRLCHQDTGPTEVSTARCCPVPYS